MKDLISNRTANDTLDIEKKLQKFIAEEMLRKSLIDQINLNNETKINLLEMQLKTSLKQNKSFQLEVINKSKRKNLSLIL